MPNLWNVILQDATLYFTIISFFQLLVGTIDAFRGCLRCAHRERISKMQLSSFLGREFFLLDIGATIERLVPISVQ